MHRQQLVLRRAGGLFDLEFELLNFWGRMGMMKGVRENAVGDVGGHQTRL